MQDMVLPPSILGDEYVAGADDPMGVGGFRLFRGRAGRARELDLWSAG